MADKEIKIRIDTQANTHGAKEATAAIEGVSQATEKIDESSGVDDLLAKLDQLAESARESRQSVSELAEEVSGAEKASGELSGQVDEIARIQKAAAISYLAKQAGAIGARFKEAASEVEGFDRKTAEALKRTGEQIERVSGMVSQVAMGFAAGGPAGAAVTSLALVVGELVSVFQKAEIEAVKAGAAQRIAMEEVADATRKASIAAEERDLAITSGEAERAINRQTEALRSQTDELESQTKLIRERRRLEEEVLTAMDRSKLADIDKQEVEGAITREDAMRQRAQVEFDAGIRKRTERRLISNEDARNAASRALAAADLLDQANDFADSKEDDAARAMKIADEMAEYLEAEIAKITTQKGGPSESDQSFLKEMSAELDVLKKRAISLMDDAIKARDAANAAAKDAGQALKESRAQSDRTNNETQTLDSLDKIELEAFGTRQRTLDIQEKQRAEKDEDRRRKEQEKKQEELRREKESISRDMTKSSESAMLTEGQRRRVKEVAENLQERGASGVDQAAEAVNQVLSMLERLKAGKQEAEAWTAVQKRIRKLEMGLEAQNSVMKKNLGRTGAR